MTTTNPRLQITLTPRSRQVLGRIGKLNRIPVSRVIAQVLEEAAPVLEQVASTMEALQDQAKGYAGTVRRRLAAGERRSLEAAAQALELLGEIEREARTGAGVSAPRGRRPGTNPRTSNTGVTPRSGTRS
jgi:replication-associated recombination protein RarA